MRARENIPSGPLPTTKKVAPPSGKVAPRARPGAAASGRAVAAADVLRWLTVGVDDPSLGQRKWVDPGYGDIVAAAREGRAQARMPIISPGHASEREADAVAERVVNARQCLRDSGREQPAYDRAPSTAPTSAHDAVTSRGRPLDPAIRTFMEPRFGQDFAHVRIHDDVRAARSAQAIGARAYTVGRNIVFAEGQYDAHTDQGKQLIAHELTHTIQQADGEPAVAMTPDPDIERRVSSLARMAIEELDGRGSPKVLLSTILAAAKLSAQREFVALLRAAKHDTYGDHFVFLMSVMESEFGSRAAVGILQMYADVDVGISHLNYDLDTLAAVARFKSLASRYRDALENGEVTPEEHAKVGAALVDAESALRGIEHPRRRPDVEVKQASGVAVAAGVAWRAVAALATDDVTGIGVADDVAIPFVIVAAVVLSAVALSSRSKPEILDYRPAMTPVQAVLAMMAAVVGTATILMAENVADTGIMEEVHSAIRAAAAAGAALTICEALSRLMSDAKRSGDNQRVSRIKKTQKAKGCRHSRHG